MIVVDVNVVAYLLIEGHKTETARQVYQKDSNWLLPPLWRSEFLNILALQIQHRGFNLATALQLWNASLELFAGHERVVDMEVALRIAAARRITGYDAQYLALAEQTAVLCVSEDRELTRKFPDRVVRMARFLE